MHLDTPTVAFVTVLVVCLQSGILAALWVIHRDMRGPGYWAVGGLVIALGVLGIFLRGNVEPSASLILPNFVIVLGFIITWCGIELFFGRPQPLRLSAVILTVSALYLIYFTLIDSNSRLRVVCLLVTFALMSGLRCYSMLRAIAPGTRFSQILSGSVFGIQTTYNLVLAVVVWMLPPAERPMAQATSGWIFLLPLLLSIASVFAAVLLVNQTISARLVEAARRDALTDALTRRALEEDAEGELARARRHATPLSLLMLDIDHFKQINDQYGHPTGDAVLRQFSATIRQCLRREDIFARLGGEEFCALLPNTPVAGAALLAERIRSAVADLAIESGGQRLSLKVSVGVATFGDHGTEWQELMRQADAALYAAKHAGRNQVVIAGSQPV